MDTRMESNIQRVLDSIGTDMLPCPETGSNTDPLMHDLYISKRAEAYFKKRVDAVKKAMKEQGLFDNMPVPGEKGVLCTGEAYILQAAVRNATKTLDKTKLSTEISLRFKVSLEDVQEMFALCSKESKPAELIDVIPMS